MIAIKWLKNLDICWSCWTIATIHRNTLLDTVLLGEKCVLYSCQGSCFCQKSDSVKDFVPCFGWLSNFCLCWCKWTCQFEHRNDYEWSNRRKQFNFFSSYMPKLIIYLSMLFQVTWKIRKDLMWEPKHQDILWRTYVLRTIYDLAGNDLLSLPCSLWTNDKCVTLSYVKTDFGRFWTEILKTAGYIM